MKQYNLEELKTYLNTARTIVREESCGNVRCVNCFMHIEDDDSCGIWDDNVLILVSLGFINFYSAAFDEYIKEDIDRKLHKEMEEDLV